MNFSQKIYLGTFLLAMMFGINACLPEDDGIPEDLNLPVLEIQDVVVEEEDVDQVLQVTIRLSEVSPTNVVVNWVALAGTATAELDYQVLSSGNRLLFEQGETEKKLEIRIKGDEVKEIDEIFQIQFYSPSNATLSQEYCTITIKDDDDNSAGLTIPSSGYSTPLTYAGYNLVWADEFDGTTLNTNDWTYEIGDGCPVNCGWGNNELEYYRAENTSLVEGNLVITARAQKFGNRDYTSSRLITKGKRQFKFGRIDIRAALPKGKGLWPALWMLGSNIDAVGWPACGEIDIMELAGDIPNRVVGTVHYGPNVAGHQYISQSTYLSGNANFNDAFHVFSILWEADKIQFLVDDVVYHTITPASLNGVAYPFNKNFFFVFNVAVGGTFPGNPDASTAFPQWMVVDYVRVFQPQ